MTLVTRLPAALLLLPVLLLCAARDSAVGQEIRLPDTGLDRSVETNLALCGTLATDRVLRAAAEPYVLCASGASVTGGAALRIEPGVTVRAEPGAGLRIRTDGVLQAAGTEASPIRFLGADPTHGSWRGIWHESDSERNELAWVEIAHGGTNQYANLYLDQRARIRIRNSIFRDAGTWGLHMGSSTAALPEFRGNRFHGNALAPMRIFASHMSEIDSESTFAGNGRDVIEVRSATLAGDPHVWGRTTVPFLLTGTVNVSTSLEVAPGFQLLATDGAGSIRVRTDGSIHAVGTAAEPIRFLAESDQPGAWSGLWIESDAGNELRFVEIAHGGRGSYDNIYLGSRASVSVENSIIRDSARFGINVSSGTATVTQTENFFRNNASGDLRSGQEVLTLGGTAVFSPGTALAVPELASPALTHQPDIASEPVARLEESRLPFIEPEEPLEPDPYGRTCGAPTEVGTFDTTGTSASRIGAMTLMGDERWFLARFPKQVSGQGMERSVPTIELTRNDLDAYRFDLFSQCGARLGTCGGGPDEDATSWMHDDREAVTTFESGQQSRLCPYPERVYVRVRRTRPGGNAFYQLTIGRHSYAILDPAPDPEPEPSTRERAVTSGTERQRSD